MKFIESLKYLEEEVNMMELKPIRIITFREFKVYAKNLRYTWPAEELTNDTLGLIDCSPGAFNTFTPVSLSLEAAQTVIKNFRH